MPKNKFIYLDNASTSNPKPKSVVRAMERAIRDIGVNPGRGGYIRAHVADRFIYDSRLSFAKFFNLPDPSRLIFTPGGTYSLNMAIRGFLKKGDHVIVTGRQHNAAVRPLLEKNSACSLSSLKWDGTAPLTIKDFKKLITSKTHAIVVNHASNVDGLLFPLEAIGKIAKKLGLVMIVDAAQTAGLVNIDMAKSNIGLLCVTGHKGLLGPAGIGILAIGAGVNLRPIVSGGTGSFSEKADMPAHYPDRLEAGSLNLPGIAGMVAGLNEIKKIGVKKIFRKKMGLTLKAFEGLKKIDGVTIYWPKSSKSRVPLFSFTIEGIDPSAVGDTLDRKYGIACRIGLHCAPEAHKEIGAYPQGTIRFSPGYYTKAMEIKTFVRAVADIAKNSRR